MQVAPAELEAILAGHPEITDAAVIPCVSFLSLQNTHTHTQNRKSCICTIWKNIDIT